MDKNTAISLLNSITFLEFINDKKRIQNFIYEQEKYAELGRLALTTKAKVCSNSDFFKRGAQQCEKHCTNYPYCQLRAELLVEGE